MLLLEAGGRDNWIWFHIPVGYLFAIGNPRSDWMFKTEPDAGLNGRSLNYPRGKVIGGSSAINAMIYMRGQAADYDHWRQLGLTGWGWDDVLPFFKQHEDHFLGRERASRRRRRMAGRAAARALGAARCVPRGGGAGRHSADRRLQHRRQRGLAPISTSTRSAAGAGRRRAASSSRCSSAPNLRLETGCLVERVDVRRPARRRRALPAGRRDASIARCRGEVILSAGAIGSPQILLALRHRAGARSCSELGIPVVLDMPGVGENLQDHLQLRLIYKVTGVHDAERDLPLAARRARMIGSTTRCSGAGR